MKRWNLKLAVGTSCRLQITVENLENPAGKTSIEKADAWLAQMPCCEEKCTFSLPNNPRLISLIYSRFPFPLPYYIITNGYNALLPVAWLPVFCFCSLPIVTRHYLCGQHITVSRYFFPEVSQKAKFRMKFIAT